MKKTLKVDPTLAEYESTAYGGIKIETEETDIFWIVRCAIGGTVKNLLSQRWRCGLSDFVYGTDRRDSYDCVVQVKSRRCIPVLQEKSLRQIWRRLFVS